MKYSTELSMKKTRCCEKSFSFLVFSTLHSFSSTMRAELGSLLSSPNKQHRRRRRRRLRCGTFGEFTTLRSNKKSLSKPKKVFCEMRREEKCSENRTTSSVRAHVAHDHFGASLQEHQQTAEHMLHIFAGLFIIFCAFLWQIFYTLVIEYMLFFEDSLTTFLIRYLPPPHFLPYLI